jgi:hypothetical protein
MNGAHQIEVDGADKLSTVMPYPGLENRETRATRPVPSPVVGDQPDIAESFFDSSEGTGAAVQ